MHTTRFRSSLLALLSCLGLLAGCKVVQSVTEDPAAANTAKTEALFSDLVRFSDRTLLRIQFATQEFAATCDKPGAAIQAAAWNVEAQRNITQIVGGANSISNLLDIVVLATLSAWMHEDHWIPDVWGEADRPVLVSLRTAEQDGWTLLGGYLEKTQIEEAREVMARWRREHPKVTPTTVLELPSFYVLAKEIRGEGATDSSLLGLVGLDPLSGLEPVARQVELARRLGQRALYFAQRAPLLVASELDLRVLQARATDEVRQVLGNVDQFADSLKRYADLGESLPEVVRKEREAAVAQVGEVFAAQRAGLVQDLAASEKPLQSMLERSQATLESATRTSLALKDTVQAVEGMLRYLNERSDAAAAAEAAAAPATPPSEPAEPPAPSKPFDPAEYGALADDIGGGAERLGGAAREITALLVTLDERLPAVQKILDETALRGQATLDRALLRVLGVGLCLIVAAALAAILVRRLSRGAAPARATPSS